MAGPTKRQGVKAKKQRATLTSGRNGKSELTWRDKTGKPKFSSTAGGSRMVAGEKQKVRSGAKSTKTYMTTEKVKGGQAAYTYQSKPIPRTYQIKKGRK